MKLLERSVSLDGLSALLDKATSGEGQIALIRGEAGIGKTSVLEVLLNRESSRALILRGLCDDLITPRTLGPFYDIAVDQPFLAGALEEETPDRLRDEMLTLMSRKMRPTVVALEDVQWADQSTLDVIAGVGRRLKGTCGLLVLTYRDSLPAVHPLHRVLAQLPADRVHGFDLQPLSVNAVNELVGDGVDAAEVRQSTGGIPFLVAEVARHGDEHVSQAVIHSIVARTAKLPRIARRLIETLSVVPGRAEIDLLKRIDEALLAGIGDAETAGIVISGGDSIAFRHELARRAVERSLQSERRRMLHAEVLAAAEALEHDISRQAHHALGADDAAALVRILPAAASAAARHGNHREAVAYLRSLGPHLSLVPKEERAELLEQWALHEMFVSGSGLPQAQEALVIRRGLGDEAKLGASLLQASRSAIAEANADLALTFAQEAARSLDGTGGDPLAAAHAEIATLHMFRQEFDEAIASAAHALELSDDRSHARVVALIAMGTVEGLRSYPDGRAELESALEIGEAEGFLQEIRRARSNLVVIAFYARDLGRAQQLNSRVLQQLNGEGPAELAGHQGLGALIDLYRGNLHDASTVFEKLVVSDDLQQQDRISVATDLAMAQIRMGRSTGVDQLIAAEQMMGPNAETAQLQRLVMAEAEHMYLSGRTNDEATQRALAVLDEMQMQPVPWDIGDLAIWLWLDGHIQSVPTQSAEPVGLLAAGEWAQSATAFGALAMPYHQALALAQGDANAQLEALQILDLIDAKPMASIVRRNLASQGIKGIPRGPLATTRADPRGLTKRQQEVLKLLERGLSNTQIAERLYISPRTAEKHVAAVLVKTEAKSRADLVVANPSGPA